MGWNFDDYPGFNPKITPAHHSVQIASKFHWNEEKTLKSSAIKGIEFSGGYFPTIASS